MRRARSSPRVRWSRRTAVFAACLGGAALAGACGGGTDAVVGPTGPGDTTAVFPGFDISIYPGDAAMEAWKYPASPYQWTGYYLPAPCHRDTTWAGKRQTLSDMGWGFTVVYVGQQDWTRIPAPPAVAPRAMRETGASMSGVSSQIASCSSSLLGTAEGALEADDAAAKLRADGFPLGSTVFLDVEYVTAVSPELLAYVRGWVGEVRHDGFAPGIYAALSNADTLHAAATATLAPLGGGAPPFWIPNGTGFTLTSRPADVGASYARLWQGTFDVVRSFNGVSLTIDEDVAASRSPSTP